MPTPETQTPAAPANLPPVEPPKPAEAPVPQDQTPAPAPKMFSEEEVNNRIATIRGGHEGTVKKMRGEIAELNQRITDLQTQSRDAEYENWARALEESGSKDQASLIRKASELEKSTRLDRANFEKEKASILAIKAELDEAGKRKYVEDVLKEYSLPNDQLEVLLALEDRKDIKVKATELALEQAKSAAVPPTNLDKGPTRPTKVDFSKMPMDTRMGTAMLEEFNNT